MEIRRKEKNRGHGDPLITGYIKNIYIKKCKKERERNREGKDNNLKFLGAELLYVYVC